ncbi:3-oxoacyl-[acyl-carrier-protein] synthase II [Thecamonas trahens ATCC 50062]|uniref:beta-ketoacyl-[acyl-carrier-protein] synthase I n=1 Tax=Thecamonas trahens ATCC 50062 TaxID=461836 RepID=A0A0L0DDS3_THETB|nr:3-oxoacyl-[acyl-carrier-protein] synthase II [Thecamonas trahens ATCC 50062]KNC50370.1 3-oxoacyl-[acyl-carrier-protein] synthase II [Thecamonas trahens ATCC 50062]|eukprot:XP_013756912.1 3-oxoacyl-[acyl-carrier-protein] synthase II [Thecamonas trahens ATCC 50062]
MRAGSAARSAATELATDRELAVDVVEPRRVSSQWDAIVWQGLASGASATRSPASVAALTPSAPTHCTAVDHPPPLPMVSAVAPADVPFADLVASLDRATAARSSRFIHLAAAAAAEALEDAEWAPAGTKAALRTGVALGSGMGSMADIHDGTLALVDPERGPRRISPFFVPRILVNLAAGTVSIAHGLQGPNHAVATACATGAHSIGDAANFIALGYADVMVAGSSEAALDPLALTGFARAKALSTAWARTPEVASRPFDQLRDGFVMGEGAGVLVLEEREHAIARGAHIYAELQGYGLTGDAHHTTAPAPDGRGALRAMRMALRRARVPVEELDYINAHATSTSLGDAVEYSAIHKLLSDAEASEPLLVSSSKGAIGHLLGASGSVEALITVLALHHGVAPVNTNLENIDAALDSELVELVQHKSRKAELTYALSNSFGFGGTNVSLCFASGPAAVE